MSKQEIDRFVEDLKSDTDMRDALRDEASGVGSVTEFAKGRGYDISPDEVRAYLQEKTERDLSDEQLDAVAGGKGHHHHHHHHGSHTTSTSTVQTTQTVTTQTVGAETTAEVAAEVVAVVVVT